MATPGWLKRSLLTSLCLVFVVLGFPVFAGAAPYGGGTYGNCSYQGCAPTSTQTTLPTGLKVSVNLVDGQVIPRSGFRVIATPLNGSGSTFATAAFYVDDALQQTVTPGETGEASWFWDPVAVPGSVIKVVVTGTDGTTATQEFHVTVGAASSVPETETAGPSVPAATPSVSIFKATYNQVKRVVRALPKPVVYTFPYALLLALAANVVVLSLQGWRELKSYRRLELFVTRERNISEAKLTLLELAAHYLRTPLTVLSGGIEMIASEGLQKAADSLKAITTRLHDAIEQLLVKTRQVAEDSSVTATQSALPGTVRIWRQPGLLLPPLLIALIVVPFDLVARNVKTLNVTQANLAAQLISYAFLVVLLYLAFRYVHLRRRETAQLELVGQDEAATARARDELMTDTTTMLASNITGIDQVVATLPVSGSVKFVTDGVARFHNMQDKLLVAARLRGSTSQEAPQAVQVNTLVHDAWQALAGTATPRNIQLKLTGDSTCYTPDPELLSTVIRSLLDNAIAYSTDNSVVQVNSEPLDNGVSITVSDTGKGIPQEKISLLFQPFFKAEGAETFTHEGMGFSLYLDRLIMNYIGGNITLESKPEHGTTVRLDLPG